MFSAAGPISDTELYAYPTCLNIIIDFLHDNTPHPDIILINYYDLFIGYSENLPNIFSNYTSLSEKQFMGIKSLKKPLLKKLLFSNSIFRFYASLLWYRRSG